MKRIFMLWAVMMVVSGWTVPSHATLIDQGGGLIYDSDLDITWLQDAGLGGLRNWTDANTWADNLTFGGFTDWRLPSMDVNGDTTVVDCRTSTQVACLDNELGYMYYQNLGGTFGLSLTGNQLSITNIASLYWSGTEFAPGPTSAWGFVFGFGGQGAGLKDGGLFAWAVRPGNVSAVPEPSTLLLLGSGLVGLIGFGRKKGRIRG